jgi:Ran-binding protein 1
VSQDKLLFRAGADKDAVVPDMKLSPNVGSDRSWVWNAAADVSEGEPEAQTLAIRFANSESTYICHKQGVYAC